MSFLFLSCSLINLPVYLMFNMSESNLYQLQSLRKIFDQLTENVEWKCVRKICDVIPGTIILILSVSAKSTL